MCLLVVAWLTHPRYRLVVAGNRDEFHDRPTAPLGWWPDEPDILAGRDLRAAGTWLGVARSGRFGLLTNFRDAAGSPAPGAPSRGRLVPDFLRTGDAPDRYLAGLRAGAAQFAGFSLLLGDDKTLYYYSNVEPAEPRALGPGLYGLSNHRLDEPWPKLVRTRERVAAALAGEPPLALVLLDALADSTPAPPEPRHRQGLPDDLETALSAPFVRHARYGTRCSTVLQIGQDGHTIVHEHRFDPAGAQIGATRFEFGAAAE